MSARSILIADDHELFADGLRGLIEQESDLVCVGQVRDGRAAIKAARTLEPDLVIMDVTMPGMNGIEATRRMTALCPGIRVLCLSMHDEPRFVEHALAAGAAGYLLKDTGREQFLRAVRALLAGNSYLAPEVAGTVMSALRDARGAAEPGAAAALTPREREILQLLAEGRAAQVIAARLHLSVKTVHTHRENLMRKLDIHSIAGLTKYAIRTGLTSTASDSAD